MDNPVISIYMTTYYHEAYVKQALDSVLSQLVKVPFELIISDDCSEDGTKEILCDYANKYPNIILNFNKTNLGMTKNIYLAKSMCKGDYVIGISGDDYWTDKYKLQKQYDFLEKHKEYVGVATQIEIRADNDIVPYRITPRKANSNKKFTLEMFLKGMDFPLNGLMQRNLWKTDSGKDYFAIMPETSAYIDDLTDCILLLKKGNVYILSGTTVVYRVRRKIKDEHNFNVSNQKGVWFTKHIELLNSLQNRFGKELDLSTRYAMVYAVGLLHAIYYKKFSDFNKTVKTIPLNKKIIVLKSLRFIPQKIFLVLSEPFIRSFANRKNI